MASTLIERVTKGLPFEERRSDSLVLRGDKKKVLAEVLIRKGFVRVNVTEPVKEAPFEPTRSAGSWASFARLTPDNVEKVHRILAQLAGAPALKVAAITPPPAPRKRKATTKKPAVKEGS
jgi:hypothetical protein